MMRVLKRVTWWSVEVVFVDDRDAGVSRSMSCRYSVELLFLVPACWRVGWVGDIFETGRARSWVKRRDSRHLWVSTTRIGLNRKG